MRRRKDNMMSKLKSRNNFGRSEEVACLPVLWHPAYRRREVITAVCMERENLSSRCEGEKAQAMETVRVKVPICSTRAELPVVMKKLLQWQWSEGEVLSGLFKERN